MKKLFDKEDEDEVLRLAGDHIWTWMIMCGPPVEINRCCVCGSSRGIRSRGWYGYRCDDVACTVL